MSMLTILRKLSKKKGNIEFQWLSGAIRGFKALPKNRKRWAKNEKPIDAEIRYLGSYEDALELCKGNRGEKIAFIVWVPRKEFLELIDDKGPVDSKGGVPSS